LFLDDLYERAEAVISSLVTVPLSDNQFSALCSFVYNIGAGHFKASSALHILNNGDLGNVPAHIMLWDEAGGQVSDGLILRRQAEVNLWSTPDDNA
jgi:lysozyme